MTRHWLMALPAALALVSGSVAAEAVTGTGQVTKILKDAGYTEVRDIELDETGLWEAEVRGTDGRWHDVHVVGTSGELLDDRSGRPLLTAADITARLQKAGYTGIHDLDLDDALWQVDATRADRQRVELTLNGFTGELIHEELDD